MPDALTIAGLLLVVAPLLGAIPLANPQFFTVWSAPREQHIERVAAHRRAWSWLNAGFVLATVGTSAGLVALVVGLAGGDPGRSALVAGLALAYAMAGVLWCAVLAIRVRTTPALQDLGITPAPGAAEVLLGAATGGMFAAFVLMTSVTLVALGAVLALTGTVAAVVAWVAALIAAVATGIQLVTGDTVPAFLYVPTLLIGVALLAGWI